MLKQNLDVVPWKKKIDVCCSVTFLFEEIQIDKKKTNQKIRHVLYVEGNAFLIMNA